MRKLIPALLLCLLTVTFVSASQIDMIHTINGMVGANIAAQCNTTANYTYGSYYTCSNNISQVLDTRYQEFIGPGAWLYYNDPTGTWNGSTALWNSLISAGDYINYVQSSHGGFSESSAFRTIQFPPTAFVGYQFIKAYFLMQNDLGNITISSNFGKTGMDDFNFSHGIALTDNGRWNYTIGNDSGIIYRMVNSTNTPYMQINYSGDDSIHFNPDIDDNQNMSYNFTLYITYKDDITNDPVVYFMNKTAGTYHLLCTINTANDGQWKTIACPADTTVNYGVISRAYSYIRLNNADKFKISNVSIVFNRTQVWMDTINKIGYALTTYYPPGSQSFVGNQELARANVLLLLYNLTGNTTYNDYAYQSLNNVTYDEKDGIYGESFGQLFTNAYDANYMEFGLYQMAIFHNLSGNDSILPLINKSYNISSYLYLPNMNQIQGGYGGRTWQNCGIASNDCNVNGTDNKTSAYYYAHAMQFAPYNDIAKRISNYWTANVGIYNISNSQYSRKWYFTNLDSFLDIYHWWKSTYASPQLLPTENASRFYVKFSNAELIFIQTDNYFTTISYNSTGPANVIADLYVNATNQHLISGKGGPNWTHGGARIVSGNFSNAYDINATMNEVSTIYPYSIRIDGLLKNNTGQTNNINFTQTYTFYDDRIEISVLTNSSVTLENWMLSRETAGGIIEQANARVYDNITLMPLNFNMSLYNTSQIGAYGRMDLANATGSNFSYIIGVQPRNASSYITDNQSRRLALPVSVSDALGNTAILTNNISVSLLNVVAVIKTNGVTPSSPRISYPDGSSVYPSYSYDSVAGVMTFTTSLPSGTSVLLLHTQEDGQSCYDFTFAERAVFVLSILAGLVGFVYFVMSGSSSVAALLTGIFAIVIFLTIFGRLVGGIC